MYVYVQETQVSETVCKNYVGYRNYIICTEELIEDLTISMYVYRKVN